VKDPGGQGIGGAQITADGPASRATVTSSIGEYEILSVAQGTYSVSAAASGFNCDGPKSVAVTARSFRDASFVCTPDAQGGGTITLRTVDPAGNALNAAAVAVRTGSGAWQPMSGIPVVTGRYEISLPPGEERFGFAVRCVLNGHVLSYDLTKSEVMEVVSPCPPAATRSIGVQWNGLNALGPGSSFSLALYGSNGLFGTTTGGVTGSATSPSAPVGMQDLALAVAGAGGVLGAKLLPGVDVPATGAANFNFDFTAADMGGTSSIPAFNLPAGITSGKFGVSFRTLRTTLTLGTGTAAGGSFYTVPPAMEAAGQYVAAISGEGPGGRTVTHAVASSQGATFFLSLPLSMAFPAPSAALEPVFTGLGGTSHVAWSLSIGPNGDPNRNWSAVVSRGWAEASNLSYTFRNPTNLPGFENLVRSPGNDIAWEIQRITSNRTLAETLGSERPVSGLRLVGGAVSQELVGTIGTFTIPGGG